MEQFKQYAYFYNLFYKDKDYNGEALAVLDALKKNGLAGNRIVSLGCGTGKHESVIGEQGYTVHGIDLSDDMIDIAKNNCTGPSVSFEVADIRTYRTDKRFDAAISLFQVMSYQNTNDDIVNAFKTARSLLEEDGIFLFDVWYGPGVLADNPVVRIKRLYDEETGSNVYKIAEPVMHDDTSHVDVCYEILVDDGVHPMTSFKEKHIMRYYFRPEIEYFLKEAGFELIGNYSPDFGPAGYDCFTGYFIAKAI